MASSTAISLEAVLLTGGESRRMGHDKASLLVDGEAQANRIIRLLGADNIPVTVLGKTPVEGAQFLADDGSVQGPIDALRRFRPTAEFVLVLSCDLPCFDARLVSVMANSIKGALAIAPFVDGFRQPMVALYRGESFNLIPSDATCPMDWLNALNPLLLSEADLGLLSKATRGANTPKELTALTGAKIID